MVETDKLIPLLGVRLKYLTRLETTFIDNWVFPLHYKFTSIIILLFSVIATCTQFFGEPILCLRSGKVPEKVINNFCWIEGTFTLPRALSSAIGSEVAYPGIDNYISNDHKEEVLTHKYYQWVGVTLFIQSCCFFASHLLWKSWEGGRVKAIVQDMNKFIIEKGDRSDKERALVKYLLRSRHMNSVYAIKYAICEALNVLHVLCQLIFMDFFLGGEFSQYGLQAVAFLLLEPGSRPDPMARVFPKMSKCTFFRFGPSGDVQKYDNLCLLPLNVINEKIFVFLWVWLLFLGTLSTIVFFYRILVIASKAVRRSFARNMSYLASDEALETVLRTCGHGDLFLLHLLSKNLDPLHFSQVFAEFARRLKNE